MSKIIQYLTQNPQLIPMILKEEICLVGFENELEKKALIDVLNEKVEYEDKFWN